jgi:cobalt-precorrin 5A hydrolase/precorrin-3B C17-methyltransferase
MVTPRGYLDAKSKEVETVGANSHLYPITLNNMPAKIAVVVGGGIVGTRKVQGVLAANGQVVLISPKATPVLVALAEAGQLVWEKRSFQAGDVARADLIFAATDNRAVNAQVAAEARERGVLCNVADNPSEGDFHSAAVLRQDGLVIGVNNESRDPRRAVQVREKISACLK